MSERRTKGGYESGDVSVSELLGLPIPEVLFRPGIGYVPPEQAVTRPADRNLALSLDYLTDVIELIRRRWDESRDGTGRPFLVEALESQAAITVQLLRAAIPEGVVDAGVEP